MASPLNRLMAKARMTHALLAMVNPTTPPDPALAPLISMMAALTKPGCVDPSMVSAWVITGRAFAGLIVKLAAGRLNAMISGPGFALASRMACCNDPSLERLVLVTENVAPGIV